MEALLVLQKGMINILVSLFSRLNWLTYRIQRLIHDRPEKELLLLLRIGKPEEVHENLIEIPIIFYLISIFKYIISDKLKHSLIKANHPYLLADCNFRLEVHRLKLFLHLLHHFGNGSLVDFNSTL